MGYRDIRANESRVHTRITDSGSGREQQCRTITIWRTESGCDGDQGRVSIPDADTGTDAQDVRWGIVSPKCLNGDDTWAGDRCSVQGPSGRSGCVRDRQDNFEVLEGSPMWVLCLSGLGVRWTGPIALWVLGLVRIRLGVLRNIKRIPPSRISPRDPR